MVGVRELVGRLALVWYPRQDIGNAIEPRASYYAKELAPLGFKLRAEIATGFQANKRGLSVATAGLFKLPFHHVLYLRLPRGWSLAPRYPYHWPLARGWRPKVWRQPLTSRGPDGGHALQIGRHRGCRQDAESAAPCGNRFKCNYATSATCRSPAKEVHNPSIVAGLPK